MDVASIKIHSLTSRIRTLDSFLDSVERKESEDPFTDVHDLVGLRVVCLFLSDIDRVRDVVKDSFTVLKEENKVEGKEPFTFG